MEFYYKILLTSTLTIQKIDQGGTSAKKSSKMGTSSNFFFLSGKVAIISLSKRDKHVINP